MAWLKKKRPITVHMRTYNAYLRRPRVTVFPIRAVAYLMRWNWPSEEAIFGSLLTLSLSLPLDPGGVDQPEQAGSMNPPELIDWQMWTMPPCCRAQAVA